MNTFGSYPIANPLPATPSTIKVNTGQLWEYISVINLTPYELNLNFEGQGSLTHPEWHRDDIPVNNKLYLGQLFMTPQLVISGQTNPPTSIVIVNAWAKGELPQPLSVSLVRHVNTSSQAVGPQGQIAISHFSGTGTPAITLNNVPGQLLVLDGWDLVMSAGSGTGSVTLTMTVTGILINGGGATNWKADYVALQGTALGTIDHQNFPNRGCIQQANTNIVFSATLSATLATGNNVLAVRYHYETLF